MYKTKRTFIGIFLACFISTSLFNFSSCKDKEILYIQTTKEIYYSCYIYTSKAQSVYYYKDKEEHILDLELKKCEKIVRAANLYTENTINLTTNPYDYISTNDRSELQLSQIDALEEQIKQDHEYYESDLYKEWEAMKLGFVISNQAVSQYSYLYTYSAILNAKLYMNVTYKLSDKKSVSIEEKKNSYRISYYTYSYDNDLKLLFEKRTIEIPISQVTLIQYA